MGTWNVVCDQLEWECEWKGWIQCTQCNQETPIPHLSNTALPYSLILFTPAVDESDAYGVHNETGQGSKVSEGALSLALIVLLPLGAEMRSVVVNERWDEWMQVKRAGGAKCVRRRSAHRRDAIPAVARTPRRAGKRGGVQLLVQLVTGIQ